MEPLGVGVGPESQEVRNRTIMKQQLFNNTCLKVWVTEKLIANCTKLYDMIKKRAGTKKKFLHEKQDESNIAFKMIRDDAAKVIYSECPHNISAFTHCA